MPSVWHRSVNSKNFWINKKYYSHWLKSTFCANDIPFTQTLSIYVTGTQNKKHITIHNTNTKNVCSKTKKHQWNQKSSYFGTFLLYGTLYMRVQIVNCQLSDCVVNASLHVTGGRVLLLCNNVYTRGVVYRSRRYQNQSDTPMLPPRASSRN